MILHFPNERAGFSNALDLPFMGVQYIVNPGTTIHPAASVLRVLLQSHGFKTQGVADGAPSYELDTIYFWVGAKPLN
jgi:hypothetical protein